MTTFPRPTTSVPNEDAALAARRPPLVVVATELRPKQWLKNGALFLGLVYALRLTDPDAVARALIAFVSFCCISSAGYIFNDLRDLQADRLHPTKRERPLASGALSLPLGRGIAVALFVAALFLAIPLGGAFLATSVLYAALSVIYSLWWKQVVLIDIFSISGGFVLRAVAGAVAIGVRVSPWLYVCLVLGSLLIALGKRRSEVLELRGMATAHRPALQGYTVEFLDQLIVIAAAASVMAYSLYTFSAENVPRNNAMMVTIPVVVYGMFQYLYLVQVRGLGSSPEELLLTDRSLAAAVVLFLVLSGAVLYLSPLRS